MDTLQTYFSSRHIGPSPKDVTEMVKLLGCGSLDEFIDKVLPKSIRLKGSFAMSRFRKELTEDAALSRIREIASQNEVYRSFIGMGYYGTLTPGVIQRNVLENPGWYTQYTPYQPEISQGRLEALLNFQTMVAEMTGLPIANASLLDEGTAAAEAMSVMYHAVNKDAATRNTLLISDECFPQTIDVVVTRAEALGISCRVVGINAESIDESVFGVILQYPGGTGGLSDPRAIIAAAHSKGALVTMAADILALALVTPPGELGADIAVGSTQRFGIPFGYGGPHAAYFSTKDEYKRVIPGRIVGVSKDTSGKRALRLALQTREQHIRREKATSNICTAQVLLAVMAGMYATYHGPEGVRKIAARTHEWTKLLAAELSAAGLSLEHQTFFDTLTVKCSESAVKEIRGRAERAKVNLRYFDAGQVGVSLDETVNESDFVALVEIFTGSKPKGVPFKGAAIPDGLSRKGACLTHPIFSKYHSETEFLRYIKRLESRDLSLCQSMIPLGSCTMKLNATTEMVPVTWESFGAIHPFAPLSQTKGYQTLFAELETALCEITGFDAVSLQPNAGSQGEYAGLMVIKRYLEQKGEGHRTICLIPKSAHGTNPASAVMAGMSVVVVNCDDQGNIDLEDLTRRAEEHKANLAALMITYPSTHGVFEATVHEAAEIVHSRGGQVYLDGANLNALVGLCRPADIGADVCHMNLHKTFCIPHGGGGPGMGPIGVKKHLAPHLPSHPLVDVGRPEGIGAISAAPWGSASILPISWSYIAMMGEGGLAYATKVAILNANYIAKRLEGHFPVLYKGQNGYVAHECILDCRELKSVGVEVDDIAKRLMDYGFHAPTVSWPVAGTVMVEPTESEPRAELDRFCDAMIAIRDEARSIEKGTFDRNDNPLKNSPHTADKVLAEEWTHPYSRMVAAFPVPSLHDYKFWPSCGRIDAGFGDRNLVCSCPPLDQY